MPKCPRCNKEVYFAERRTSMGKDWHRECLRCERCSKTLAPGQHSERDGRPYCNVPCYQALFGPQGCGMARGTVGSFVYEEANNSTDKPTKSPGVSNH